MHRLVKLLSVVSLVCVAALVGPLPSVQAGESVTITVEKVIVGTPPADAEFVVAFDCGQAGVDDFTFTEAALGPQSTFALLGTCTLSETSDGGASSVSYACVASGPGVESCVASDAGVAIEYVGSDGGGDASITVTNTFAPDPDPAVEPQTQAAAPVVAQPSFTG